MNERFVKLLELNNNMDKIIQVAKIETDKMQIEVEQYKTDAVNRLFKLLEDIKPMMDVICSNLEINYNEHSFKDKLILHGETTKGKMYMMLSYNNPNCTNYGFSFSRPHTPCNVCIWDKKLFIENNNLISKQSFMEHAKEFIAENINEITEKTYKIIEKLLIETIENKAKKQRDLQEGLQEKINKFKTE